METEGDILEEAKDPNGIRVVLLRRIWLGKIVRDHPEMTHLVEAVLRTVSTPDHLEVDPVSQGRKRYFTHGLGPSRWLLVVVSYEQAPARIISAFAYRKDPPSWSA